MMSLTRQETQRRRFAQLIQASEKELKLGALTGRVARLRARRVLVGRAQASACAGDARLGSARATARKARNHPTGSVSNQTCERPSWDYWC